MTYDLYFIQISTIDNTYRNVYKTLKDVYDYKDKEILSVRESAFYIQNEGFIALSLPGASYEEDSPNYIVVKSGDDFLYGLFITKWTFLNGSLRADYKIDFWHTYFSNTSLLYGIRTKTNWLNTSTNSYALSVPVNVGAEGPVSVEVDNNYSGYTPIFIGYTYTGEIETSSTPSQADPFFGYMTNPGNVIGENDSLVRGGDPFSTGGDYYFSMLADLLQLLSSTKLDGDRYIQITNIYLVPNIILQQTKTTSSSFISKSEWTLYMSSSTESIDWTNFQKSFPNYSNASEGYFYAFGTTEEHSKTIHAFNVEANSLRKRTSGGKTYYDDVLGYGFINSYIKFPPYIKYSNQKAYTSTVPIDFALSITQNGVSIKLSAFGQVVDISDLCQVSLTFTPEQAQVAEQRRANAIASNVSTAGSVATGIMSSIGSFMTGNILGGISSLVSTGVNAGKQAYEQTRATNSDVGAGNVSSNLATLQAGFGLLYKTDLYSPSSIEKECQWYGYDCEYFEEEIRGITRSSGFTCVKYGDVQIQATIPMEAKATIERVLLSGTRIWNEKISSSPTLELSPFDLPDT